MAAARARAVARSTPLNTARASSRNPSPAGVSSTPRGTRVNSLVPSSFSRSVDLLTERRLLQPEPGGRARDVPLFGDGQEIAEMTQFHRQISISNRYGLCHYNIFYNWSPARLERKYGFVHEPQESCRQWSGGYRVGEAAVPNCWSAPVLARAESGLKKDCATSRRAMDCSRPRWPMTSVLAESPAVAQTAANPIEILFVGNSFTHGRYPPALNYNAGPGSSTDEQPRSRSAVPDGDRVGSVHLGCRGRCPGDADDSQYPRRQPGGAAELSARQSVGPVHGGRAVLRCRRCLPAIHQGSRAALRRLAGRGQQRHAAGISQQFGLARRACFH